MHHGTRRDIEEEIGTYEGILASAPARAVWEVACRSSLEGGVVTADSALHRSPKLKESLDALHDHFALFPGSTKARTVMRLVDGRSESPTANRSPACSSIAMEFRCLSRSSMSLDLGDN